ncbi:putative lipase [Leptomonas seymouri]|uniref:Putative lipase n=1 Tax=Leptomonas seymouri TaxID=5684 RepID=A0A0N1I0D0_LEPSE|nr:putative lipase [Leptomonas seymouri]|eukprot:KPI88074.1 putative lipase [Leptomonas seymouri]
MLFSTLCIITPGLLYVLPRCPTAIPVVNNTPAAYNTSNSWRALQYCKAAYCPVDTVMNWSCGDACSNATADFHIFNIYENASTSNMGFSGMDHMAEKIVVVFRGTANTANWIQDLDFWAMPYPSVACGDLCTVHRGFYKAYSSIREQVMEDVQTMHARYPTYGLFVTGHSLGGAIAVLCAIELATWHLPWSIQLPESNVSAGATGAIASAKSNPAHLMPVELYTFGEPRVGNVYFTNWSTSILSQERQFRVTHAQDPVPHLPPRSWGYVHVPQEHWYPADDSVYVQCVDSGDAEDPACSNSVYATTVSDHLLYLSTCTRCTCDQETMDEIHNYTLSPDIKTILGLEYLIDNPQPNDVEAG